MGYNSQGHTASIWKRINEVRQSQKVGARIKSDHDLKFVLSLLWDDGVRKPLFSNPQRWILKKILTDDAVWYAVADYIRLELVVDGQVCHWNGRGEVVNPYGERIEDVGTDWADEIVLRRSKAMIDINLWPAHKEFVGLLDGLV